MTQKESSDIYRVRRLTAADALTALSVVQTVKPSIDAAAWQRHLDEVGGAAATPGADHGVMVLAGPNDYLYGLFTYRAVRTLTAGRVLQVDDFCVTPVAGRRHATGVLLAAAEELARELNTERLNLTFLEAESFRDEMPQFPHKLFELDGGFLPGLPCVTKTID